MIGILNDILPWVEKAIRQLLEKKQASQKIDVGIVLYKMQNAISDVVKTAKKLERILKSTKNFPKPTPWPEDIIKKNVIASALSEQSKNVSKLGKYVQELIDIGGDALDPPLMSSLQDLIQAKTGAINQLFIALGMFLYPQSGGKGSLTTICVEDNGLVQFTTGRFVQQRVVSEQKIIDFIIADYIQNAPNLEMLRDQLVNLYNVSFNTNEKLTIGKRAKKGRIE